jgi:hypothetical protein
MKSVWIRMTDNAWYNMDKSHRRVEIYKDEHLKKPNKYMVVAPSTLKAFKSRASAEKYVKSYMKRH